MMKHSIKRWHCLVLMTIGLARLAHGKPMPPPTPQEAVNAPVVVVCEYAGYDKDGPVTYFGGVVAQYKVVKSIKGQAAGEVIKIRYAFHDGTPCMAPPGWKFEENLMPKAGSRWILFLTPGAKADEAYTTYRGDYGRWAANEQNLKEVEKLLAAGKGGK